jgi:hypothetical protein
MSGIFFFENLIVYEVIWKNIVEPGKTHMATLHMRIACWMPKVTNTRSEYVIIIVFPQQQLLNEWALTFCYTTLPFFLNNKVLFLFIK